MGIKARALPKGDPVPRGDAGADLAAKGNLDDTVIAPLSELLAYAPPHRGRSSTLQARAVADDQDDRMPLFLERDDRAADDDGFHFEQREPARWEEGRQDPHATDPPAHWFGPQVQEVSADSFARPSLLRYTVWAVAAAFTSVAFFGAFVLFGGAFSGSRLETTGMRQVAQTATSATPAISFDQTFAAVSIPGRPESKPEISDLSVTNREPPGNTVAIAPRDLKLQTDKLQEQSPAPPTAPDLPRRIDQAELARLLKRGTELIDVGDIASARLLLQRAADAREPQAAFALAGTYDPAVLSRVKAYGIVPDPVMARTWYEKAKEFGSSEAQQRLEQLQK
ncbi:hypothetical protein V1291_002768 [Nitrobacteraceae bacterium AZCC 1564]